MISAHWVSNKDLKHYQLNKRKLPVTKCMKFQENSALRVKEGRILPVRRGFQRCTAHGSVALSLSWSTTALEFRPKRIKKEVRDIAIGRVHSQP